MSQTTRPARPRALLARTPKKRTLCAPLLLAGSLALVASTLLAETIEQPVASSTPLGDAWFGHSVDIQGRTLVVGAPGDDTHGDRAGLVSVFRRTAAGWTEQTRFAPLDVEVGDSFGWSVSLDGDLLAVGVPGEDDVGASAGAAYVFRHVGAAWTQIAKLTAADGARDDNFGSAVAVSGDTVAVGARSDDDLGNAAGSVYVYRDGPDGFALEQHLFASDGTDFQNLGESVALDGDVIVSGAPTASGAARAYVWERTGSAWTETKILSPDAPEGAERFGSSVDVHGDTILVGDREHDAAADVGGAVFVFRNGPTGWTQEDRLVAPDAADIDVFGSSVALGEDVAVVGAVGAAQPDVDDAGAAYVFTRTGTTWTFSRRLSAGAPRELALFGDAVAVDDDVIAVGAPRDDEQALEDTGTLTLFDDRAPEPSPQDGFILPSKAKLTPPPGQRRSPPGLVVRGVLDTGGEVVDLTGPTTLTLGERVFDLGAPEVLKRGKLLRHTSPGVVLTLTPDRRGSSDVRMSLRIDGDLGDAASVDGELNLRIAAGALDARGAVRLSDGAFRGGRTGTLLTPLVLPTSLKATLRGGGRDSVKLTATYSGEAPTGDVRIVVGDTVEVTIPASSLVEKKGRLEFRSASPGVTRLTLDPRRARISVVLSGIDLGAVADAPTLPLVIGVDLGAGAPPARIRVARRGKSLRY